MTPEEIRGMVLTLETLLTEPMDNRNEINPLLIKRSRLLEGKPIQYWIGFVSGYMLRTIESDNPEALDEVLSEAPTLRHEFRKSKLTQKLINDIKENEHE